MTAVEILNELQKRGIDIELAGEKIRLHGSEDDLDESLVESIKTHKSEIIKLLSGGPASNKSRPIWCAECEHGSYKASETGPETLWCGLADRAIIDMPKCTLEFWIKNGQGFPMTIH